MLMQCYQVDYQYVMSWDHFDDHWSNVKPRIPFKQLPILELNDGTQIGQSIAILNYIESVAGIEIADPAKAAEASSILQSAQELFAPLNPTVNFAVGDDFYTLADQNGFYPTNSSSTRNIPLAAEGLPNCRKI